MRFPRHLFPFKPAYGASRAWHMCLANRALCVGSAANRTVARNSAICGHLENPRQAYGGGPAFCAAFDAPIAELSHKCVAQYSGLSAALSKKIRVH